MNEERNEINIEQKENFGQKEERKRDRTIKKGRVNDEERNEINIEQKEKLWIERKNERKEERTKDRKQVRKKREKASKKEKKSSAIF